MSANQFWYWAYLQNWPREDGAIAGLPHLWSLAVEEQFYIVWPFVVLFTSRRNLAIICVAVIVVSPAVRYALLISDAPHAQTLSYAVVRWDSLVMGGIDGDPASWRGGPHVAEEIRISDHRCRGPCITLLRGDPSRFPYRRSTPLHYVSMRYVSGWVNEGGPTQAFVKLIGYNAFILATSIVLALISWNVLEKHFMRLRDCVAPAKQLALEAR